MIYRSTFFALVVLFALDRMKISKCLIATIPTTVHRRVGFASRPIDQLWPIEFFHFGVFRVHTGIMTKLRNFDNTNYKE